VVIAALALYLSEMASILGDRKRQKLDWGIKYFLTAIVLLFPLCTLATVLSWPALPLNTLTGQLENLYGFLALMGVLSWAIIGMLYKIIPFLVWFGRYSHQIGRAQVPALADLYSSRLQAIGYWALLSGTMVNSIAVVFSNAIGIRLGCGLFVLAVATLVINVGSMLSHFFKPPLVPLSIRATAPQPTV
jgi:hypothetical protein